MICGQLWWASLISCRYSAKGDRAVRYPWRHHEQPNFTLYTLSERKFPVSKRYLKKQLRTLVAEGEMGAKAGNWDQSEGFLTKIDRLNTSIYRFGFLTSRLDLSAAMLMTHDGWQVCLTCATANLVFRVGLGSRKTNVYLRGERLWYIYVPLKEKKEDLPEVSTIFHDRPVSFSCHCSSFGSMILGEQIVHINEGKGKLALSSTKHNFLPAPLPLLLLHN